MECSGPSRRVCFFSFRSRRGAGAVPDRHCVMSQEDAPRRLIAKLDVSDVGSIRELHERLAETLEFPDFYGKNWDAFWDAITGLVEMPRRLIITGWSNVAARWPKDARIMLDCLRDLNEEHPSWSCEVELVSESE